MTRMRALTVGCRGALVVLLASGCGKDSPAGPGDTVPQPECTKAPSGRTDAHTPISVVSDWGQPVRLGPPVNSPCPEDAIEIARDGQYLYFLFTKDILENLTPSEILSRPNGTYRAKRGGGPGDFDAPVFYDLGAGIDQSLDGEPSFSPDGRQVYFHSARATNSGYQQVPPADDFLDIYVADVVDGRPGPGRNLGPPVNSIFPDGEHAIHPDGVTLYFASLRPGGLGKSDIWRSTWSGTAWSTPVDVGAPVNSAGGDLQPAFTADGDTMYFVSDRNPLIGAAIYRCARRGDGWGAPELVLKGVVGEPSLTADGRLLYFVHVLTDAQGPFDADVWFTERVP